MYGETTSPEIEAVATQIVDAAVKVHKQLGPGLLESVYRACLVYELRKRGLTVLTEIVVPIYYDGVKLDTGLRLDILVNDCVIVETKSVEKHNSLFESQLLSYLKLTNKRLGLLLNFNVKLMKDGIKRVVN